MIEKCACVQRQEDIHIQCVRLKRVGGYATCRGRDSPHDGQREDKVDRAGTGDLYSGHRRRQETGHVSSVDSFRDHAVSDHDRVYHGKHDGHERVKGVRHKPDECSVSGENMRSDGSFSGGLQISDGLRREHVCHHDEKDAENQGERAQELQVGLRQLSEIGKVNHFRFLRKIS